jgi:hypothetical protein
VLLQVGQRIINPGRNDSNAIGRARSYLKSRSQVTGFFNSISRGKVALQISPIKGPNLWSFIIILIYSHANS